MPLSSRPFSSRPSSSRSFSRYAPWVFAATAFGAGYGVRAQGESDWVPPQPLAIFRLISTPDGHRFAKVPDAKPLQKPGARWVETAGGAKEKSLNGERFSRRDPKPYQTLDEVRQAIRDNFVTTKVSDEELTNGAIRGMLRSLGDKFTRFMTRDEYKDFKEDNEGEFVGIGARIDVKDDYIGGPLAKPINASRPYIIEPIAGSPAERAGIKAGDVILSVNGKSTANRNSDIVISDIKGVRGSVVNLQIERVIKKGAVPRPEDYRVLDFQIKRDLIEVHPVKLEWMPDNIAWLRLEAFNEKSEPEITAALRKVQRGEGSRGAARGLVLDLRDNPGGLLESAVSIGSRFVPTGAVVITRERDGREYPLNVQRNKFLNLKMPIVVLVNNYSASASEVVTGAMQDRKVATVVGEPSYGKASVQVLIELQNGGALVITTAKYLTPLKHDLSERGIKPDVLVKANDADNKTGRGAQLARALDIIRQKNTTGATLTAQAPPIKVSN